MANPTPTTRSDEAQRAIEALSPFLYHSGALTAMLTGAEHLRLFAMGDGYGRMTGAELLAAHLEWDWSHIRDSSDDALVAMAEELRTILRQR